MKTSILAKARTAPPEPAEPAPPPSPAAIAAGIRRRAELQLAEHELRGLRERQAAIAARIREIIPDREDQAAGSYVRGELTRLPRERQALEATIRELRPRVAALRAERAAEVGEVLRPTRIEAAGRFLAALGELRDSWRILDECAAEVVKAGGDAKRFPLPDGLGEAEALARSRAK